MKGTRGGCLAALPDADWQPPQRVPADAGAMTVRFIEESGARSQVFDFARLSGEPGIQRWLARAFARRTGPRSGVKRLESAHGIYGACRRLAAVLAAADPPPSSAADVTSAHIAAFSLRYAAMPTGRYDMITSRALLREDPDLPEPARASLLNGRLPAPADRTPAAAYEAQEWQLIMAAVRGDVRRARDRIRAGRALLARYRARQLPGGSTQARLGELLDIFDRTGNVPRRSSGDPAAQVAQAGGVDVVAGSLCLTADEMTAFGLLLTAQTGQNFGTVAAWPAVGYQPGDPLTLIEQVKPRRGPDREHMVVPLEDLPPSLAGVLSAAGGPAIPVTSAHLPAVDRPDRMLASAPGHLSGFHRVFRARRRVHRRAPPRPCSMCGRATTSSPLRPCRRNEPTGGPRSAYGGSGRP